MALVYSFNNFDDNLTLFYAHTPSFINFDVLTISGVAVAMCIKI